MAATKAATLATAHAQPAQVDVRDPDEHRFGHVLGALNIPLAAVEYGLALVRGDCFSVQASWPPSGYRVGATSGLTPQ